MQLSPRELRLIGAYAAMHVLLTADCWTQWHENTFTALVDVILKLSFDCAGDNN